MVNLEQVKLLEAKVAKTIDFVERVSRENAALLRQEAELQQRLESYQKRIDELEVLIMGFKEEQGRIEDGILSALDRLSQFEDAIEKSLKEKHHNKTDALHIGPRVAANEAASSRSGAKEMGKASVNHQQQKAVAKDEASPRQDEALTAQADSGSFSDKICFEIPEDETGDDILDPLTETLDEEAGDGSSSEKGGELDIF